MSRLPLILCLALVPGAVTAQEAERFTTPAIVVGKITQIDHRKRTLTIESSATKKAVELKAPVAPIYFVDGEKVDFDDFKVGQEKVAAYFSEKTFRLISLRRHVDLKLPEERAQSKDSGTVPSPEQQKIAKLESDLRSVTEAINQRRQKKASTKDLEKKKRDLEKELAALKKPESTEPADSPKPAPEPKEKPTGEQEAGRKLKLAKTLLDDGLKDKARVRLKEIVEKYPDTKAAKEAKELLEKLAD